MESIQSENYKKNHNKAKGPNLLREVSELAKEVKNLDHNEILTMDQMKTNSIVVGSQIIPIIIIIFSEE